MRPDNSGQPAPREQPALDLPQRIKEYYNTLRDRLLLSVDPAAESPRLILVTSCYSGEGSTTVAANLAVTLAHHGRVLLADANMNRPAVHRIFNLNLSPGLGETLQSAEQAPVTTPGRNLDVLPAGHMNGSVAATADSPQNLAAALQRFKRDYEFVVIDAPAVNESSASLRLASLVDGVVLVVEAGRTRWETVRRAKEQLLQIKANLVGIVLNKRRFPIPRLFYRR